jgi:hypothetical protein
LREARGWTAYFISQTLQPYKHQGFACGAAFENLHGRNIWAECVPICIRIHFFRWAAGILSFPYDWARLYFFCCFETIWADWKILEISFTLCGNAVSWTTGPASGVTSSTRTKHNLLRDFLLSAHHNQSLDYFSNRGGGKEKELVNQEC